MTQVDPQAMALAIDLTRHFEPKLWERTHMALSEFVRYAEFVVERNKILREQGREPEILLMASGVEQENLRFVPDEGKCSNPRCINCYPRPRWR